MTYDSLSNECQRTVIYAVLRAILVTQLLIRCGSWKTRLGWLHFMSLQQWQFEIIRRIPVRIVLATCFTFAISLWNYSYIDWQAKLKYYVMSDMSFEIGLHFTTTTRVATPAWLAVNAGKPIVGVTHVCQWSSCSIVDEENCVEKQSMRYRSFSPCATVQVSYWRIFAHGSRTWMHICVYYPKGVRDMHSSPFK